MSMHSFELTDGTEIACNQERAGVFFWRGTEWSQSIGTGETPRFRSPSHMMAWVRAHMNNPRTNDGKYPAVKRGSKRGAW